MTEPEVNVEVVEAPETPEVVVVESGDSGAVEDALALVEHVEEDVDKWVDNAKEHMSLEQRIQDLEMRPLYSPPMEAVESVEEIVEETWKKPWKKSWKKHRMKWKWILNLCKKKW